MQVNKNDLIFAGWENGMGPEWYLKSPDDSQTHLHLRVRRAGRAFDVLFVSIKFQDRYYGHYYDGGPFLDRGSIEGLPEGEQTLFRKGLNAIGLG